MTPNDNLKPQEPIKRIRNDKVNITKAINKYLHSFLLSASLKVMKSYKTILYCWIYNTYGYNMHNNTTKRMKRKQLYSINI